jgi:hypothetical protein
MNPKLPIEFLERLEPLEAVTAYLLLRNDNLETMVAAIEIARIAYSEEFSPDFISLLACAAVPDPITPENITGIATSTAIRLAFDESRRKLLFDLKEGGYEYIDPVPATL